MYFSCHAHRQFGRPDPCSVLWAGQEQLTLTECKVSPGVREIVCHDDIGSVIVEERVVPVLPFCGLVPDKSLCPRFSDARDFRPLSHPGAGARAEMLLID